MIYHVGEVVIDSESWFTCDKGLCDTFGVHYTGLPVFESYLRLTHPSIDFQLDNSEVSELVIPSCTAVRLSDFGFLFKLESVRASENGVGCVATIDDKLTCLSSDVFEGEHVILNLTEVTKDSILTEMYKYSGVIIDRPERQPLYECESYVFHNRVTNCIFDDKSYEFFWSRSDNLRRWTEAVSLCTALELHSSMYHWISSADNDDLCNYLALDGLLYLGFDAEMLLRYLRIHGKRNKYVDAYLDALKGKRG